MGHKKAIIVVTINLFTGAHISNLELQSKICLKNNGPDCKSLYHFSGGSNIRKAFTLKFTYSLGAYILSNTK